MRFIYAAAIVIAFGACVEEDLESVEGRDGRTDQLAFESGVSLTVNIKDSAAYSLYDYVYEFPTGDDAILTAIDPLDDDETMALCSSQNNTYAPTSGGCSTPQLQVIPDGFSIHNAPFTFTDGVGVDIGTNALALCTCVDIGPAMSYCYSADCSKCT